MGCQGETGANAPFGTHAPNSGVFSKYPAEHATTKSFILTPALMRANVAALMHGHMPSPSAWMTCTKMSIWDRGYRCVCTASSNVCFTANAISNDRRSPARRFRRSDVLNGARLYSQLITARSWWERLRKADCTSRGCVSAQGVWCARRNAGSVPPGARTPPQLLWCCPARSTQSRPHGKTSPCDTGCGGAPWGAGRPPAGQPPTRTQAGSVCGVKEERGKGGRRHSTGNGNQQQYKDKATNSTKRGRDTPVPQNKTHNNRLSHLQRIFTPNHTFTVHTMPTHRRCPLHPPAHSTQTRTQQRTMAVSSVVKYPLTPLNKHKSSPKFGTSPAVHFHALWSFRRPLTPPDGPTTP